MHGLMDMKHLQRSKNQIKFHYMLNELICQKQMILPGNLERVGVTLLAIPENPHALLIFLEGGAARAFVCNTRSIAVLLSRRYANRLF